MRGPRRVTCVKELIEKAQKGDPEAFIQLIELNKQSLYKIARGYFSERMDAEDAVAETVTACWEHLDKLQKPAYFKTWLIRILINKCNDIKRSQHRVIALDSLPETADRRCDPDGLEFDDLMGTLSEPYRVILVLHYSEGLRVQEIARLLELPAGTVKSRLKRGRDQLSAILEEGSAQYEHA